MTKHESVVEGTTEIVGDTCTLYPRQRSRPVVTRVLGRREVNGVEDIYLDRMVHERFHDKFCGYAVSGAVTTILSRPVAT